MSEARHKPSTLVREAASLFHLLGGMTPKHLVIVGGLVPPLLVPGTDNPHIGSADIDLSLSVAITEGATSEYYRSIENVISPYFELVEGGFRWRKKKGVGGVPIRIDFLGPEIEATGLADGSLKLEDGKAATNTGRRLRPFPLRAGRLVDVDAEQLKVEDVELVYRPGAHANVAIRHTGPVGFLASKADALDGRDDPKDGYDIAWWCINARPTAEEVARLLIERPAFSDSYFQESVAKLDEAFKAPNYVGPDGYARECNPSRGPGDEVFEQDRNLAWQVVSTVIALLRESLWEGRPRQS